jgi:uncharacterized membrane protein
MKHAVAVLATGLALLGPPAHAAVTFDYIFDNGYPLSVSDDGKVIAGNQTDSHYTPFRWTQATGLVSLGRPQIVGGGGVPAISADGSVIASSIGSTDSSYTTQGRWTLAGGWQELMPPVPADGGLSDGSYGSVWGLSRDGATVVGLYWRPGQGNRAHASKWTQATGVVDLGGCLTGQASRANGVNFDGSVIAGWVETPVGPWRPAAWVNGSLVLLSDVPDPFNSHAGIGEAKYVSPNGDYISGFMSDPETSQRAATIWKRENGVFGPPQVLGWVEGSEPEYGINIAYAVSNDGRIAVGYCSFDGAPFATTGLIWTEATGVQDINQYLADNGILVDPNFTIQGINAMTPDGTQIFGYGQMLTPPYTRKAFRITIPFNSVSVSPPAQHARLELEAPRPNPSSSATRIDFALTFPSSADLSIYDTEGRRVSTLVHAALPAGRNSATWDGRDASGRAVPAGVYLARLATPQGTRSRTVVRVN